MTSPILVAEVAQLHEATGHANARSTSEDLESLLQGLRQNRPGREDASAANLNQSTSSYSSGSSTRDSDLVSLQRIWIAERTAPEILPFDEALIDRIMGRLRRTGMCSTGMLFRKSTNMRRSDISKRHP